MTFPHASPQLRGSSTVALQTEGAHVREIAFTSAFHYRENVIGVPKAPARAPILFKLPPGEIVQLALILTQSFGIEAALRANAAIAGKYLLPKIAGIGPQPPFMHASGRAERKPPGRNRGAAPAAVPTLMFDPSSAHGSACTHPERSPRSMNLL
jgi:hypothetical protein